MHTRTRGGGRAPLASLSHPGPGHRSVNGWEGGEEVELVHPLENPVPVGARSDLLVVIAGLAPRVGRLVIKENDVQAALGAVQGVARVVVDEEVGAHARAHGRLGHALPIQRKVVAEVQVGEYSGKVRFDPPGGRVLYHVLARRDHDEIALGLQGSKSMKGTGHRQNLLAEVAGVEELVHDFVGRVWRAVPNFAKVVLVVVPDLERLAESVRVVRVQGQQELSQNLVDIHCYFGPVAAVPFRDPRPFARVLDAWAKGVLLSRVSAGACRALAAGGGGTDVSGTQGPDSLPLRERSAPVPSSVMPPALLRRSSAATGSLGRARAQWRRAPVDDLAPSRRADPSSGDDTHRR